MRIVENSPAAMRLEQSSGILPAILLAGAAFVAVYVVARHADPRQLGTAALFVVSAVFFRRITRVSLDKTARRLQLWRTDMWRRSERTLAFDEISDVQVELERADAGPQVHCRLTLSTAGGGVPLTAGYLAGLDRHIALRDAMVEVIFAGRTQPAPLDPAHLLRDAGRPFQAAIREDSGTA